MSLFKQKRKQLQEIIDEVRSENQENERLINLLLNAFKQYPMEIAELASMSKVYIFRSKYRKYRRCSHPIQKLFLKMGFLKHSFAS